MYNFIIDADALIKLTYSGIIAKVCENFNCFITAKVKEETVDEGKKRFYPDADIIDGLIKAKLLKIKDSKEIIKSEENFGQGELSVLSLYKNVKNHIIITDDQNFIRRLEKDNINFLIPADIITLLKKLKKSNLKESLYYLKKIRVFIKEEVYKLVKKDLEED